MVLERKFQNNFDVFHFTQQKIFQKKAI